MKTLTNTLVVLRPNQQKSEKVKGLKDMKTKYLSEKKETLMTSGELEQKLRELHAAYDRLAKDGYCDEPLGAEYSRVREEWFCAGCPGDVDQFIKWRANVVPLEKDIVN